MNDPHETDHGKGGFGLPRKEDPDTKKILHGRWEVLTDADLTDGAKVLFVLLQELALNPAVHNGRRGEITISTTQLSEKLSRCPRAIWGWTAELKIKRFIWVSKKRMPNMKPMNQYHITVLQPIREAALDVTSDGMWGNGARRSDSPMPQGARGVTGKKQQVLLDPYGLPVSSESFILLENAAATRTDCHSVPHNLRMRPARNDTSHPQVMRGGAARNDTCHPQVMRGASAELAGLTRTNSHLLGESQVEKETVLDRGETSTTPEIDQEAAFRGWERRLDDLRYSDLRKVEAVAAREFVSARTAASRRKLVAIRLRLLGESQVEKETVLDRGETSTTPDQAFEEWCREQKQLFPDKRTPEKELRGRLETARSPETKAFWKRRLDFLAALRLGGTPPAEPAQPGPVRAAAAPARPKPPRMSDAQLRAFMAKAKAEAGLPV